MKRLLLILSLILIFISCEKRESKEVPDKDILANISPRSVVIDKEKGGSITIETDKDAFVTKIAKINNTGNPEDYYYEVESFFYKSFVKLEDIIEYDKYEALGCKVIPNGFREFTIIIEPNCDCTAFNVHLNIIYESKEYGLIGSHTPSIFNILLE